MVISRKIQIRLNVLFVTLAFLGIAVFSMYELGYLDELFDILAKDNYIFYWMLSGRCFCRNCGRINGNGVWSDLYNNTFVS
jgi:hypothetical protein